MRRPASIWKPCFVPSGYIGSADPGRSHATPVPPGFMYSPLGPNMSPGFITSESDGMLLRSSMISELYAGLFTTSGSMSYVQCIPGDPGAGKPAGAAGWWITSARNRYVSVSTLLAIAPGLNAAARGTVVVAMWTGPL